MKKVIVSVLSLVTAYSLTVGTAVAMFLPRTQLQNIALRTSNLALQLSFQDTDPPTLFSPSLNMGGPNNLLPGTESAIAQEVWVNNASSGTPGTGKMTLVGKFQATGGDWETLKNIVELQIETVKYHEVSGWHTLSVWEAGQNFPGETIGENQSKRYRFTYRLPATYSIDPDGAGPLTVGSPIGNELMGKSVLGSSFVIEGHLE